MNVKGSGGGRRAPETKNKMLYEMELLISTSPISLKYFEKDRIIMKRIIKVRGFYNLVFAVAMETCSADLGIFARSNGFVFMMDKQIMQSNLRCDAEGKDQQHQSAQNSPY